MQHTVPALSFLFLHTEHIQASVYLPAILLFVSCRCGELESEVNSQGAIQPFHQLQKLRVTLTKFHYHEIEMCISFFFLDDLLIYSICYQSLEMGWVTSTH